MSQPIIGKNEQDSPTFLDCGQSPLIRCRLLLFGSSLLEECFRSFAVFLL
jgi:hypothetical protein